MLISLNGYEMRVESIVKIDVRNIPSTTRLGDSDGYGLWIKTLDGDIKIPIGTEEKAEKAKLEFVSKLKSLGEFHEFSV